MASSEAEWIAELQPAVWIAWNRRAAETGSTLVPALEAGEMVVVDQVLRTVPSVVAFDAMIGFHPFERFERVYLRCVSTGHGRAVFQECK